MTKKSYKTTCFNTPENFLSLTDEDFVVVKQAFEHEVPGFMETYKFDSIVFIGSSVVISYTFEGNTYAVIYDYKADELRMEFPLTEELERGLVIMDYKKFINWQEKCLGYIKYGWVRYLIDTDQYD